MTVKERRPTDGYVAGASMHPRRYGVGEKVPLNEAEGMLVTLRYELYEGSWSKMLDDLRNRRNGRPYMFKQVNRIEADIERIDGLKRIEQLSEGFIVEETGEGDEAIHVMRKDNRAMMEKYDLA